MTGNTILITGGGSGIGRGLAEAFHALGNQVIIAGRRQRALDETTQANPGMKSEPLNIEDPVDIVSFAKTIAAANPSLNLLINNAGVMRAEDLLAQKFADVETTITTNLLGPIRLTSALLPLLQQQPASTIMNVSSGLAFVPMASTPTYSATKAAMHSYTMSLRYQLEATTTEVLELIPPYVQTDLMGGGEDPRAMALKDFIEETMQLLSEEPTPAEICVERVHPLRYAAENGNLEKVFRGLNDAMRGNH